MSSLRYYTPREIALHSTADDLWVSLNGKVLDLTPLVKDKNEDEIFPLLAFAGKDISHLLDNEEVKLHVDPETGRISSFCPFKTLIGSPSQQEAEELFLKRKRQEEEVVKAFMQKYMSERIGTHRKKPASRTKKQEISEDQSSEGIQHTPSSEDQRAAPLLEEISQQQMLETTPSETDHAEEQQHSETDRQKKSSSELQQSLTEQPTDSADQKPAHRDSDKSLETLSREKLDVSESSLTEEKQIHGTDSPEKDYSGNSSKEDTEVKIPDPSSRDNSLSTTQSNERGATESQDLKVHLPGSEEKEMVHNETESSLGKETTEDEAPVMVSREFTQADDQQTKENSQQEHSDININVSSTLSDDEDTIENLSENVVSDQSEKSSMAVPTASEDENNESPDIDKNQSEIQEAKKSDSKVQDLTESLSFDASEKTENQNDDSLLATDHQDLDANEENWNNSDPSKSLDEQQANNNRPEITSTDKHPDPSASESCTESHEISSDELQPFDADSSAKAYSKELSEPCKSTMSSEQEPANDDESPSKDAWWKDSKYVVGLLTQKPRWVKIFNTLIMKEVKIEVCSEDTISDILQRYLKFNSNASNYTWKYLGTPLNMQQTLDENGIPDRDDVAARFGLNPEYFVPNLHLYYNDLS